MEYVETDDTLIIGGKNWADIEDDEDEGEDIDEIILIRPTMPDPTLRCCRLPTMNQIDENAFLKALHILSTLDVNMQVRCLMNEIENCYKVITNYIKDNVCSKQYKLEAARLMLKMRHEILCLTLFNSLGLSINSTDIKFSSVLPIDSNRTPDYIKVDKENVIIVEFMVTSDVTKGKFVKGGGVFISKYEDEINLLKTIGYNVYYNSVIVDGKDYKNNSHLVDITDICSVLNVEMPNLNKFDALRSLHCRIHMETVKIMSPWYSLTFDDDIDMEIYIGKFESYMVDHQYEKHFQQYTVPLTTYNKILLNWHKLSYYLVRQTEGNNPDTKIKMHYDLIKNRFEFKKDLSGKSINDFNNYLNNYDRFSLLRYTIFEQYQPKQSDLEYYDLTDIGMNNDLNVSDLNIHPESYIINEIYNNFYYNYSSEEILKNSNVFEDENYDELLINSLSIDVDLKILNPPPFSVNKTDANMFQYAVEKFNDAMKIENINNNLHRYQKPAFLYPLFDINQSDYCDYKEKNYDFLSSLSKQNLGLFTTNIITRLLSDEYTFGTRASELPDELNTMDSILRSKNREMTQCVSSFLKNKIDLNEIRETEEYKKCKEAIKLAHNNLINCKAKHGYMGKLVPMLRYNNFRKSDLYNEFVTEKKHYKNKNDMSVTKGVGLVKDDLYIRYRDLKFYLMEFTSKLAADKFIDEKVGRDCRFLEQLKTAYVADVNTNLNKLTSTNLYHSLCFISRMCHTLFYHSQTTFNHETVCYDNLGYKNVLMIIKGGKKIFKTKKSKLYRLIYPINNNNILWFNDNNYTSSFTSFDIDGISYICTPWSNMDEVLLHEGLTLKHKIGGYLLLNSCNRDIMNIMNSYMVNVLLAIHARRKTEVFMHNTRYLSMNSMSSVSKINEMLLELAGFNYDLFQAFLRQQISNNFINFATRLHNFSQKTLSKNAYNVFQETEIVGLIDHEVQIANLDDLASFVYSTFLMPKAPVNQQIEQANNLINMLKINDEYFNKVGGALEEQLDNSVTLHAKSIDVYWKELNKNDFVIDPTLCTRVGTFMKDYLSNKTNKDEILSGWLKIMNECWDEMANTKGLRGMDDDKFFGNKGYYVIYDELLTRMHGMTLKQLFESTELSEKEKNIRLNELNIKVKDEIMNKPLTQLNFHVVDKRQRGGGREIYVMDLNTKLYQQPLEKMFRFLCDFIPNEVISVPSNKRLMHIHTQVFEKPSFDNENVYNLVLDCRKWAPKSVFLKYQLFVNAMSDILPTSFLKIFYHFFNLMYSKRIYTRSKIAEIIENNKNPELIMKNNYLIEDTNKKGHYFLMPYSFVMGIFNYLSSLFHVSNQLYASYIIRNVFSKSNDSVYLNMLAHSDDSSGKLMCPNEEIMLKSFWIYQLLLKGCNHLISDKKSCISKVYYEFLSILYVNNELLSLLTKFIGNFTFKPTDKGLCVDLNDVYNKCIELFMHGATFQQCYLAMKVQANMIYQFYLRRNPDEIDYETLPQLGGMPDSHPLMIIISGTDAELIRIYTTYENDSFIKQLLLTKYLSGDDKVDSFVKYITTEVNIIKSRKLDKHISHIPVFDEEAKWIVNNVNLHNTAINMNRYLLNLEKTDFCAALQDDTIIRRLSRSYYFRSNERILTKDGHYLNFDSMKNIVIGLLKGTAIFNANWAECIKDSVSELLENKKFIEDKIDVLFSEVIKIYSVFNRIEFDETKVYESNKTCKPVHLSLLKISTPTIDNFSPANLSIWLCYPKYRWLFKYGHKITETAIYLEDLLNSMGVEYQNDINFTYRFLRKYQDKFLKNIYCYSNMPSNEREILNYRDLLSLLSHNSFKNKYISNVTTPYDKPMNLPLDLLLNDIFSAEFKLTSSLICFINGYLASEGSMNSLNEFVINEISWIPKFENIAELLSHLINYWRPINIYKYYLMPLLNYLYNKLLSNIYLPHYFNESYFHCFTKRQIHINNQWLGRGELYINLVDIKLLFIINNLNIIKVYTNKDEYMFNTSQISYINYTLFNSGMNRLETHLNEVNYATKTKFCFGLTKKGVYNIDKPTNFRLAIQQTELRYTVHEHLSDLSISQITPLTNMQFKIIAGDEQNCRSYKIYTYDILTNDYYNNIMSLLNNENNRKHCEAGQSLGEYLDILLSDITELPITVDKDTILLNYNISKLYKIMKELNRKELINIKNVKLKRKSYPAEEGGMLCALLDYKELHEEFKLRTHKLLGPEYMNLKRMQPGLFMSELYRNFVEKFKALYSPVDREIIIEHMGKLLNDIEKGQDVSLIKALTTWGFVGVMGSISEADVSRTIKAFKMFKESDDLNNISFNSKLFMEFNVIILKLYIENDLFYLNSENFKPVRSKKDVELRIISAMTLISYNTSIFKKIHNKAYAHSSAQDIYASLILPLFNNDETMNLFKQYTSTNNILSLLDITKESASLWIMAVNCMMRCHWLTNTNNKEVPVKNVISLKLEHNCVHLAVEWCKNLEILRSVKMIKYAGFISVESIAYMCKAKVININNVNVIFECKLKIPKGEQIPINSKAFLKNALSEDNKDDILDEIKTELASVEPDNDCIKEVLDNYESKDIYEPKYNRQVKRMLNGKLTDCHKYICSLFLLPKSSDTTSIKQVRQHGETLIIISASMQQSLIYSQNKHIAIFKPEPQSWIGHSLVNPECLYIHVVDSEYINVRHWEVYLNAKQINHEECLLMNLNTMWWTYNDVKGNNRKISTFANQEADDIMDELQNLMDTEVEEETDSDVIKIEINECKEAIRSLKIKYNLSDEFIDKYEKQLNIWDTFDKNKYNMDNLLDAVKEYANKLSNIDKLLTEAQKIMKKPKTMKEHMNVTQIPSMFGVYNKIDDVKTKILNDQLLRSEIESMFPNIIDKLLTGSLYIKEKTFNSIKKFYGNTMRGLNQQSPKYSGRKFWLKMFCMIVNDADITTDCDNDDMWGKLLIDISDIMDDDEDYIDDIDIMDAPTEGTLKYRIDIKKEYSSSSD